MSDDKTPQDVPLEAGEELTAEEAAMLDSHIKKNAATEPTQFTVLYYLISVMTVACISYVFVTILDLSVLDPINAIVYLASGGATAYLLADSYLQMYENESAKGLLDSNGKYVKELEARSQRKNDSIKNRAQAKNAPAVLESATSIFKRQQGKGAEWRDVSKADRQNYADRESAQEVAYLSAQIAELRHFQYQKAMGWALLFCNAVFITGSVVVSQVLLRQYDQRVNYIFSTAVTGLVTSLVAKQQQTAAKN